MVKLIGNIKAEDDYTHELGPEPNFNESVYFNFFDPHQQLGGFVRIGNRANEGYAEMTVIVWNPDGSAMFYYNKPQISHNDAWDAGGLKIEVLKPAEHVRTTYLGKALFLADPTAMRDPSAAFKDNPRQALHIDLEHFAVGPMYGHVGDPDDSNQFARAHTEQHMRVNGSIKIDDRDAVDFSGWGLRDHSWGPRYWQAAQSYRWITGNYGDDLGMVVTTNGEGIGGGVFHEGEELVRIRHAELATEFDANGYHNSLEAALELEDGRKRTLQGRVVGYIPLRNRRAGANTNIGEGMTQYTLTGDGVDERRGYGLSEYLNNNAE